MPKPYVLSLFLISLLASSCKEVETISTVYRLSRDTVYVRDSIVRERYRTITKADTIVVVDSIVEYGYRDRYISRTDTVRDTVRVKEIVREPVRTSDRSACKLWIVGLVAVLASVAGFVAAEKLK